MEDTIGEACSAHGGNELHTRSCSGNLKDHWEDIGVDGRIILKWILKK
jgi:hypothetical protein